MKVINTVKEKVKDNYDIDLVLEPSVIKWDEV